MTTSNASRFFLIHCKYLKVLQTENNTDKLMTCQSQQTVNPYSQAKNLEKSLAARDMLPMSGFEVGLNNKQIYYT